MLVPALTGRDMPGFILPGDPASMHFEFIIPLIDFPVKHLGKTNQWNESDKKKSNPDCHCWPVLINSTRT